MKVSGRTVMWTFCQGLMRPQKKLKSKRRSKTQKETPEESSPNGQDKIDEIDVEDPHPNGPETPSLLTST